MKSFYQNMEKIFIGLVFLIAFNNCFAYRDHTRFIRNDSQQDWVIKFTFTEGSTNWWSNHIIGLVTGSDCVQDQDCVVKAGESKTIIYRVPKFDGFARDYNGSLIIKDSSSGTSYVYKIQGQLVHFGPWIYDGDNNGSPKAVVTLNNPQGGDIVINKDSWKSK